MARRPRCEGPAPRSSDSAGPAAELELAEARRLLGGDGLAPSACLGLPADVPAAEVRGLALDALTRWRRAAEDPRSNRARTDLARVVARTVEGILAGAAAEPTAVR